MSNADLPDSSTTPESNPDLSAQSSIPIPDSESSTDPSTADLPVGQPYDDEDAFPMAFGGNAELGGDESGEDEDSEDELYEHLNLIVDKGQAPLRIDKFLSLKVQNSSRSRIQAAAESGAIRVQGQPVKSNYKVRPLDQISVLLPNPPRDTELKPEDIPLNIVFEDEHILVINKVAGMVVHPGFNNYTGTLVNAVLHHLQTTAEQMPGKHHDTPRPGLVHRIDKDTSGLLVLAKDEFSMTHLAKQFFYHTTKRSYLALVWGSFDEQTGTVKAHLNRSPKDRRIMMAYPYGSTGKHAITHYEVLENFIFTSLVACRLETGRTHQIRAHMRYLRHPIFNDAMYDGERIWVGPPFSKYKQFVQNAMNICPRQALHAHTLGFIHPHTGKELFFEAPLPTDMSQLIHKWKQWAIDRRPEDSDYE